MRRLIGLLLGGLLLAGCGVTTQDRPEPVDPTPSAISPPADPRPGSEPVQVHFLRGDRLEPVTRLVAEPSLQAAMEVLLAGPTPEEARAGIRTAVAPQLLRVVGGVEPSSGTVTIVVTSAFTGVSGANQKLAVAQVVWTATEAAGIERVRFVLDSEPIEVPTDSGLTSRPVDRGAYRSVSRIRRCTGPSGRPRR